MGLRWCSREKRIGNVATAFLQKLFLRNFVRLRRFRIGICSWLLLRSRFCPSVVSDRVCSVFFNFFPVFFCLLPVYLFSVFCLFSVFPFSVFCFCFFRFSTFRLFQHFPRREMARPHEAEERDGRAFETKTKVAPSLRMEKWSLFIVFLSRK